MTVIELLDFKGDYMELTFAGEWIRSRKGLWEMECYAKHDWNEWYTALPMPLFSEWWDI